MSWRKNREIIFDFTKGKPKITFNSDKKYYEERIKQLEDIEDYEAAANLRDEAKAKGIL